MIYTLLAAGSSASPLTRFALPIGIALFSGVVAAPSAAEVDPARLVDAMEGASGKFVGYRRAGAKGVCVEAEFVGSADGRALSVSSAFSGRPIPVIARFSVGSGHPMAPDNTRSQRNMALQLQLPHGEVWQMGNISAPVFGASTPEQFLGRLESFAPDPSTGKPDPVKVKAFGDANPEVLLQGKYLSNQAVPASYAGVNYWGVHAFAFVDARGRKQFGKWIFEPVGGTKGLSDEEAKDKGANFLIDELRQRVASGTTVFDFNLQLAEQGDSINSATIPLPQERPKVTLGQLKLKSVSSDSEGGCLTLSYNPMLLPKGIEPSADPMLAARAAPYAISLGRRLQEGAKQ